MAPGDYELRVTVGAPGAEPLVASTIHSVPEQPPWWENAPGVTDEVLPPYEPIETAGLIVSPWGRSYVFSDALILRQLTTYPDPNAQISELAERFHETVGLPAAPIAVAGRINREPARVEVAQASIVESADDHVLATSRAEAAGVHLHASSRLDYDGIMQVELTIDPDGAADLEEMRLEIPLHSERVTLMNFNSVDGSKMTSFAGAAPAGEGVVWEDTRLPLIWLGDEYRGLCRFNDRDDGWFGDIMQEGRIQLVREGPIATLRLNFAPELHDRANPIVLRFCLCGTPMRPFPEGWRGMVRDGAVTNPGHREALDAGTEEPVRFRVWWSHAPGMTHDHGYPVPKHSEDVLRDSWDTTEGVADIQHHYPNIVTAGMPISETYYGDWASVSTAALLDQLTLEPPDGGRVDRETNVVDWWIWEINEMMKLGLDGMYIDDPYIYPSYNDRTGGAIHGEDGALHPSYGMLGLREYFRRMRAIACEHSDWPWIDIHMSGQLMLPFYVFCDSFVNGEHLNMKLSKEDPDYFAVLPVEELKAQYMGYQWGVAPYLLPELPSDHRKSVPYTREILAYFLPHDVYFWRGWCNNGEMDRALKVLQHDFRIGDPGNRFLPYWEAAGVIGGQSDTLVCSAHIKPGRVMLVIANWAEEATDLGLQLDLEKLELAEVPDLTASDPLDATEVALDGSRLTGQVGARDFRLVLLSGE